MAKTRAEKITSIEEEIRQLENKKRRLIQEQKVQEDGTDGVRTRTRRKGN